VLDGAPVRSASNSFRYHRIEVGWPDQSGTGRPPNADISATLTVVFPWGPQVEREPADLFPLRKQASIALALRASGTMAGRAVKDLSPGQVE